MNKNKKSLIGPEIEALKQDGKLQRSVPKPDAAARAGQRKRRLILDQAIRRFSKQGHAAFTLRGVACDLGISLGNLTYHYASKAKLMEDMVEDRMIDYLEDFENLLDAPDSTSRENLEHIIRYLVQDLRSEEIGFFPQIWALAMLDDAAAKQMDLIYQMQRIVFQNLITDIRPDWAPERCVALALHIQASIEGLTLFIGQNRRSDGPFAAPEAMLLHQVSLALDES